MYLKQLDFLSAKHNFLPKTLLSPHSNLHFQFQHFQFQQGSNLFYPSFTVSQQNRKFASVPKFPLPNLGLQNTKSEILFTWFNVNSTQSNLVLVLFRRLI